MTQYTQYGAVDKLTIATTAEANSSIKATTLPITVAVTGDVAFHVLIGPTSPVPPAAAITDFRYPANEIFIFDIPAGSEISIRGSAAGFAYVQRAIQSGM